MLLAKIVGRRIPVVYTMHDPSPWISDYPNFGTRAFRKLLYILIDVSCLRAVNHVIAVSPALRREAVRLGVDTARVSFIPSGVKMPLLTIERGYENGGYGLFVGRLESRKRLDLLLDAASKLTNPVRFVVVGEGPTKTSLMQTAENLGVGDKISFTGYVDENVLTRYYTEASFFVFPSTAEGFPMAILEAMSYGLPIIAIRSPSYDGMLTDRVNGLFPKESSPESLSRCIEEVESNLDLAKRLSSNATSLAKSFGWEEVAAHVSELYSKIR